MFSFYFKITNNNFTSIPIKFNGIIINNNIVSIIPYGGDKLITNSMTFIKNICNGIDNYKEERKRINDLANKYQDNKNCERILEFLGITLEK